MRVVTVSAASHSGEVRPRRLDQPRPTVLFDEELVRAVRHESAVTIQYWWGVGEWLVWGWRKH